MISERIYVGAKPVKAIDLLNWCNKNKITIQFSPAYKEKLASAYINLCTTKRENEFLPKLKEIGWKHYHYPPSTSCYKSVGFTDIVF